MFCVAMSLMVTVAVSESLTLKGGSMCLRLPALLSIMLCPRLMKACRASDSWDSVTLVLLTRGVRMMRVLASFSKMSVRLGWNVVVGPEGGSCEDELHDRGTLVFIYVP